VLRGRWPVWLLTLAVWALACALRARAQVPSSHVLSEGEELTYNVRYGPLDLGQVRIAILSSWVEGGVRVYHSRGYIDSYRGVPFVDLHAVYETVMDSTITSRRFSGRTKAGDRWNFGRYRYDPDHSRTIIEMGQQDSVVSRRDTLQVPGPCQDGLSLFFAAREHLFENRTVNFRAVVSEKVVNARIDFRDDRQSVQVDAIDYPVDVIHFEGEAEFVGLYGMTGGFEGWFSNDDARVPILAKMRVLIGSVTIELMGWKRPGWTPPKGRE